LVQKIDKTRKLYLSFMFILRNESTQIFPLNLIAAVYNYELSLSPNELAIAAER